MTTERRSGASVLDFQVLGRVSLQAGGDDVHIGGPRPRAVLALLLLHRKRLLPTERIVDAPWDEAPESARNSVQRFVADLRASHAELAGRLTSDRPLGRRLRRRRGVRRRAWAHACNLRQYFQPTLARRLATEGQAEQRPISPRGTFVAMSVEAELVNRLTWKIPNALALVGSRSGDERNAMTTSWITQLSMEPVLIGVGVDNEAVTHRLITNGGSFTVNLWDAEETRVFVKFSKPASYENGQLNGRTVGEAVTGAPVFDEAIAWVDCEVRHTLDLGTHTLFVGEVVDAAILDDEKRAAAMSDTRMKYGGVKRH